MAQKTIDQQPKVTDTILFSITTPDVDGCYSSNPYKVDRLTIYHVERDFVGDNFGEYTKITANESDLAALKAAEAVFCADPTSENAFNVQKLQSEIDSSSQKSTFYYKERVTIEVVGSADAPAWLSTDTDNALIDLVPEDEDGNAQFGHFSFEWNPQGAYRAGDYFLCWTWTPQIAGDSLSAHVPFTLLGDPKAVITIPTHMTPEDKYDTLLERYLPEYAKTTISDNDLTPQVTSLLNQSIGDGFTFIEDMANQIIDLFDANAVHESLLVYLSNFFNLKLKSSDPTLWRRQIKEAIPLFKKKGTLEGLEEAFAQSGMVLNKYTQFWQLVSPYTWTESFLVVDTPVFNLAKLSVIQPIDDDNFGLWVKRAGTSNYISVSKDYVSFGTDDNGNLQMTWIGDELSASPISIFEGDHVKVKYQYAAIPGVYEQNLENYIQTLPLNDSRNEEDQTYPPKNWNVRLIAEEDPLFDVLIPVRHPFQKWIVFGHVRTEFAYSENIYNMEEYNASTRPSENPCHIDKEFMDPCGACLSSSYSVDIGVEELSNDRMMEAQDILREYTPFQCRLFSINFSGDVDEFVQSPEEDIEFLILIDRVQFIISGQSNPFFHRIMEGGLTDWIITRDDLTDQNTVLSAQTGLAYNESVGFITPDIILQDLGVIEDSHILEVLAPSANAGTYNINTIVRNTARVVSTTIEPVDTSAFTFNLSNSIYGNSMSDIEQDDVFKFSGDFEDLPIKTQWDIENTPDYTGGSWKVSIPAYSATAFEIEDIQNGVLLLDGDSTLPVSSTSGITYTLLDDSDNVIVTGTTGSLEVVRRGLVKLNDPYLTDIENFIKAGDYLYYDGVEYLISGFNGHDLYILGYTDGAAGFVEVSTRRRLVRQQVGYFNYRGLMLDTTTNHESGLGMVNGANPPSENFVTDDSNFKENYLFLIDGEYFKVAAIDRNIVTLSGRDESWTTLANGGTSVEYDLIHLPKKEVSVQFLVFDQLDHNGKDPVVREIESVDGSTVVAALSTGGGLQENMAGEEGITFVVETRSGETYQGVL